MAGMLQFPQKCSLLLPESNKLSSLLFLLGDEVFVQVCLNQWRKERVIVLSLCLFLFFCTFSIASATILNVFAFSAVARVMPWF